MTTLPRGIAGTAGEYLVAAQLSLRGWLATVTLKNAPGTDVLAQAPDGHLVAIQTKTKTASKNFMLGVKDERVGRPDEWYVLVDLKGESAQDTDYYVVPRAVVSAIVYCTHCEWLATPGRAGHARKDNAVRGVMPKHIAGYLGRWDLLRESPAPPLLVTDPCRELIARHRRPQDEHLLL